MTTPRVPRDGLGPSPLDGLEASVQRELAARPPRPALCTGILDGNHGDWKRGDLRVARDHGIVAIIAKASEGKDFLDGSFDRTVDTARALGLVVGAYHFGSASSSGEVQADHFLRATERARAAGPLLLVLDLENNPNVKAGTMDVTRAEAFVHYVHGATGRWPVVYTGAYVRAAQQARGTDLAQCPLWMAAYGPDPLKGRLPAAWGTWALWQYTNGGAGPTDQVTYPRKTHGFGKDGAPGGCDRSVYRGTEQDLRAWWASQAVTGT